MGTMYICGLILALSWVLWKKSNIFRYWVLHIWYLIIVMATGIVVILVAPLRPCNPSNLRPIQIWWNFALRTIGFIKYETRNAEVLEESADSSVLLVNHQSNLDVMTIFRVAPYRSSFIAKKELLYAGTFGIAAWLSGLIFIDRLNKDKAMDTMVKTAKKIKDYKIKLWIFPEGTRNLYYAEHMLPFKKGAFHLAVQGQVPVYPCVISSYKSWLDNKRMIFNPCGHVIVSCLPAISTEGMTEKDVPDLMEKCRQVMLDEYLKISAEVDERNRADNNYIDYKSTD